MEDISELESIVNYNMEEESSKVEDPSDQEMGVNNYGWADSMGKVLKAGKPQRKKTPVLAKAKKLSCLKIVAVKADKEKSNEEIECRMRKADWINKGRQRTNVLERNREKMLQKIAVRGVVSLCNAVKELQRGITETGKNKFGARMRSINKGMLLDILMNSAPENGRIHNKPIASSKDRRNALDSEKNTDADSSTWNVLKKDFMVGKDRKNWDKA